MLLIRISLNLLSSQWKSVIGYQVNVCVGLVLSFRLPLDISMRLNNLLSRARFARAFHSFSFYKLVFIVLHFWLHSDAAFYFVRMENEASRLWSEYFLARNVVKQISRNVNSEACPYISKNDWLQKIGSTLCRFGIPSCLKLPVLTPNLF